MKEPAAAKAGMCENTAWKYLNLSSRMKEERTWRTRKAPFEVVWPEIEQMLITDESLPMTTIFDYLCRKNPVKFRKGQLRTLQ
ncbi:MAG: hypothetical protein QNK37_08180 [Acidobacteriota bacterium]|nr:hypothetical protein [Acidobacteriota bacterium]